MNSDSKKDELNNSETNALVVPPQTVKEGPVSNEVAKRNRKNKQDKALELEKVKMMMQKGTSILEIAKELKISKPQASEYIAQACQEGVSMGTPNKPCIVDTYQNLPDGFKKLIAKFMEVKDCNSHVLVKLTHEDNDQFSFKLIY